MKQNVSFCIWSLEGVWLKLKILKFGIGEFLNAMYDWSTEFFILVKKQSGTEVAQGVKRTLA